MFLDAAAGRDTALGLNFKPKYESTNAAGNLDPIPIKNIGFIKGLDNYK